MSATRVTPPADQVAATVDDSGQPITDTFKRSMRYDPNPAVVRAPAMRPIGWFAKLVLALMWSRGDRGFY